MSLEQKIDEMNTNLVKLITVTQALYDLRADAIEKVTAAAQPATKTTKAKDTKAADTAAEKPEISKSPEDRKDPAADQLEKVTEAAKAYIGGSTREEERSARKEKIRALMNHEKVRADGVEAGKGTLTNIGNVTLFLSQVAKLEEKGDLTTPPAPEGDDLDI